VYEKRLKMVIFLLLIVSAISCTKTIPVRLELPDKPVYNDGITKDIMAIKNAHGKIISYAVSIKAISKIAENKILCREYSNTLRKIILTTH